MGCQVGGFQRGSPQSKPTDVRNIAQSQDLWTSQVQAQLDAAALAEQP